MASLLVDASIELRELAKRREIPEALYERAGVLIDSMTDEFAHMEVPEYVEMCLNLARAELDNPAHKMTNAKITLAFFSILDGLGKNTKNEILDNIAQHYRVTREQAYAEVTSEEAESLLDYVTGPLRSSTYRLMQRYDPKFFAGGNAEEEPLDSALAEASAKTGNPSPH